MTLATEATGASSTGSAATTEEELADFGEVLAVVDAVARRSVGDVTIQINDES
jgi:hypothetical protein